VSHSGANLFKLIGAQLGICAALDWLHRINQRARLKGAGLSRSQIATCVMGETHLSEGDSLLLCFAVFDCMILPAQWHIEVTGASQEACGHIGFVSHSSLNGAVTGSQNELCKWTGVCAATLQLRICLTSEQCTCPKGYKENQTNTSALLQKNLDCSHEI
jgi:hypothetical protein